MTKLKTSKAVIRKLIENVGEDFPPYVDPVTGRKVSSNMKVIGNLSALYAVADFWEREAGTIHLIATNELLEYTETELFNADQLEVYRKALAALPLFFQKCFEERQSIEASKMKATVPPQTIVGAQ